MPHHAAKERPRIAGRFSANTDRRQYGGFIVCRRCHVEKESTPENFKMGNKAKFPAVSEVCRECENKAARERHERQKNDPAYQKRRKAAQAKHRVKNRAAMILRNYQAIDSRKGQPCDLTLADVERITSNPCTYCGDTDRIGLDRIDNNAGHTVENSLPCCPDCNVARGDRFTVEEMRRFIGPGIAAAKASRN